MNTKKIITGGIAAGVVFFAIDFVVNNFILGDRFNAELEALDPALVANLEAPSAIVVMAVIYLILGILLTWLYAAIRPRLGPGPKTAMIAGVYFWFLTGMIWAMVTVMGIFSWGSWAIGGVFWLITSLAAASVGGKLYSE